MRPQATLVLACILAMLAPTAAVAQSGDVQVEVEATAGGPPLDTVHPGDEVFVFANVTVPDRNDTAWRAYLNGTVNGTSVGSATQQLAGNGSMELFFSYTAPRQPGNYSLDYNVTVQSQDVSANATDGNETGDNGTAPWRTEHVEDDAIGFTVEALTPPDTGFPWAALLPWLVGVGVVAAGGGAAYWWTHRDRQIRGTARSKAMQELEGESFEAGDEEPEVHPELKILEARADDVRRMIELAKERYEDGELTEHQYETIRDRKESELEEIQAEMDDYREQG